MSMINRIDRVNQLAERQRAAGLDAIALIPGPNLLYFTGARMTHPSERPVVVLLFARAGTPARVILPAFEAPGFAKDSPLEAVATTYLDGQSYAAVFADGLADLRGRPLRIGVEPTGMRFLEMELLRHALPGVELVSAGAELEALRIRKSPAEVDAIRRAIALTERVLAETLEEMKPGMTERQVASLLHEKASRHGGQPSFPALIQAGSNAAFPHGEAGDRMLAAGEMVLMDFGYYVGDYPSDITRTVSLGEPPAELRKVYEVVKTANAAARAAVRPGARAGDIDAAARGVIEAAGYGRFFTHRTGHGLGLEIHEPPYMSAANPLVLEPGMVFTIEPGIYVEGLGGVRIEDNIVVTETGGESLTTFTRDLLTLRNV
ncbi:MAG: Xaa-Pro peptidase family protein [Thermoflexales bacterium]|nr:Xaa-Pro peptidase family protein [Thermoflexales bacterium]